MMHPLQKDKSATLYIVMVTFKSLVVVKFFKIIVDMDYSF